jgi:hypothetical protein
MSLIPSCNCIREGEITSVKKHGFMAVSAYQERAARKYASRMLRFLFRRRRLAVKLPDACFLMAGHGGASIYIDLHKKGAVWIWPSSEWRRPSVLGVHGLMRTGDKYFVCGSRAQDSFQ